MTPCDVVKAGVVAVVALGMLLPIVVVLWSFAVWELRGGSR